MVLGGLVCALLSMAGGVLALIALGWFSWCEAGDEGALYAPLLVVLGSVCFTWCEAGEEDVLYAPLWLGVVLGSECRARVSFLAGAGARLSAGLLEVEAAAEDV